MKKPRTDEQKLIEDAAPRGGSRLLVAECSSILQFLRYQNSYFGTIPDLCYSINLRIALSLIPLW